MKPDTADYPPSADYHPHMESYPANRCKARTENARASAFQNSHNQLERLASSSAQVVGLSSGVLRSLRHLRHDLKTCQLCPEVDHCIALQRFNNQVQAALQEVLEEWTLIPYSN